MLLHAFLVLTTVWAQSSCATFNCISYGLIIRNPNFLENSVSACCTYAPEWQGGFFRELLEFKNPSVEDSVDQSCDGHVFEPFKTRFTEDQRLFRTLVPAIDEATFPDKVHYERRIGYLLYNMKIRGSLEQAVQLKGCSPDATIKLGTPENETFGNFTGVPFVLQQFRCQKLGMDRIFPTPAPDACALYEDCNIFLDVEAGDPQLAEYGAGSLSAPVRIASRTKRTWVQYPEDFLDLALAISSTHGSSPLYSGMSTPGGDEKFNKSDPFAICDTHWAQCLSLPNGTFDLTGEDEKWVFAQPGTETSLNAHTTSRAADMLNGPITHVALLFQFYEGFNNSYNLTFDVSTTKPVIMIAVGKVDINFQVRASSSTLKAFVGTNSHVTLMGTYPQLEFFSGTIALQKTLPIMPNVKTLQLSNPSLSYVHPWVWEGTPTRQDFTCTQQIQRYYTQNISEPWKCAVNPSLVSANTVYINQNSWQKLTNLALFGIPDDLFSCIQNTPVLNSVFIDGSPMVYFDFGARNLSSLRTLRLTHNPNLRDIKSLSSSFVETLHIYGNPKMLALPSFNTIKSPLLDVDFSLSTLFSVSIPNAALKNVKKFRCVWCDLAFKFSSFINLLPNITYLDLSHNQIAFDLHAYANTTQWKEFMQKICVLYMSDNAIGGRIPGDFLCLVGGGCATDEEPQADFSSNMIESFISPSEPLLFLNQSPNYLTDWLSKFQMFSPDFFNAIDKAINSSDSDTDTTEEFNTSQLPQNKKRLWLNLKNNHLRGRIPSNTSFLGGNLTIDVSYNGWWCDSTEVGCNTLPLLSTTLVYGDVTVDDYFKSSIFRPETNSTSTLAASLDKRLASSFSPFWPFAFSTRDKQTLILSYYSKMGVEFKTIFSDDKAVEELLWLSSSGMGITTLAVRLDLSSIATSDCLDFPRVRTFSINDDLFSPESIYACRREVNPVTNTGIVPFQFSPWLIRACMRGRGFSNIPVCDACAKDTFSLWCASCLTPATSLLRASEHPECTACPKTQDLQSVTVEAGAKSVSQCVCDIGAYGFPAELSAATIPQITCYSCQDIAICVLPNATDPEVSDGYYKDAQTKVIYICDPSNACKRGVCTVGYDTTTKCSSCSPGYYRINRECKLCSDGAEILLALLAIFLFFALLILLKASKSDYTKISTISISIGYVQIISIFAAFPVVWPPATHGMLNFLSFFNFNFDLAAPECAMKTSYYNKWIMKMLLPLIACGVLALWYVVIRYWPWMQKQWIRFVTLPTRVDRCLVKIMVGRHAKRLIETKALIQQEHLAAAGGRESLREQAIEWERSHLKDRFISVIIALATVGYTFVAKTSTQPFNCLSTSNTVFPHIRADSSVVCYDSLWYSWIPAAVFFILLYAVGIPVVFATILLRAYRKKRLRTVEFLAPFGGLVMPFRDQFWYWELIQLARKLIVVLLIDIKADSSETSTFGQIAGVLVVLVLFFVLQEFLRPYEFTWCNRLEFVWTGMSLIILVGAMVFSFDGALNADQLNAFAVLIILALVAAFFMTLYTLFLEKRRVLLKAGLGSTSYNKIEDDHKMLDAVFGRDLGQSVYRKTRAMSPELRDEFFDRVSALASIPRFTELITMPLLEVSAASSDFAVFPSPPAREESKDSSVAVDSSRHSAYVQN